MAQITQILERNKRKLPLAKRKNLTQTDDRLEHNIRQQTKGQTVSWNQHQH